MEWTHLPNPFQHVVQASPQVSSHIPSTVSKSTPYSLEPHLAGYNDMMIQMRQSIALLQTDPVDFVEHVETREVFPGS